MGDTCSMCRYEKWLQKFYSEFLTLEKIWSERVNYEFLLLPPHSRKVTAIQSSVRITNENEFARTALLAQKTYSSVLEANTVAVW
jgi:hypothetical protein